MATMKAIVQFEYNAEAPDELSLRVGEVILNVKQVEEGWCNGILNGKKGVFPDNFVKMVEDKPAPKKKVDYIRKMKVTFAYEPANEDELLLQIDDVIDVIEDEEEGWAKGHLKGKTGVFPTNFAINYEEPTPPVPTPAPVTSAPSTPSEEAKPLPEESTPVQAKKVKGVGFGNIFDKGPIKLRQSSIGNLDANKKMETDNKPIAKPQEIQEKVSSLEKKSSSLEKTQNKKKSKPQEKCRVMFEYKAENDDELTLVKGDIVVIIDKNSADSGWWEGEIRDDDGKKRRGVFPDNFVVPLPDEETESEKSSPKETRTNKSKSSDVKKQSSNAEEKDKTTPNSKSKIKQHTSSLKRPAPQAPLQPVGNLIQDEPSFDSEINLVVDSTKNDQKLTHYKRPGGPKNRRKPDSTHRRERAQQATEEVENSVPEPEPEPEPVSKTPETPVEPNLPIKRETKRGVPVMPTPGATDSSSNGTPSWLANLRSRNSQKKPQNTSMSVSPNHEPEPGNDQQQQQQPAWLSNLKKSKSGSAIVPGAKPFSPVTSPKPASTTNHALPPSVVPDKTSNHDKVDSEPKANTPPEVVAESKVSKEVKKPPFKQVALQPPKQDKKPVVPATATKPKPPPPKAKPLMPKPPNPSSGALGDELRDEMKSLQEAFASMQADYKKEISRLSNELDEEKRHRINLQNEVAQLKRQIK